MGNINWKVSHFMRPDSYGTASGIVQNNFAAEQEFRDEKQLPLMRLDDPGEAIKVYDTSSSSPPPNHSSVGQNQGGRSN